jgi:hypothetical protein
MNEYDFTARFAQGTKLAEREDYLSFAVERTAKEKPPALGNN